MKRNISILSGIKNLLFVVPSLIYASPPAEVNFSLPVSQQPAPLVSFGELLIGKGVVQLYLFADAFIGKNNYLTDVFPFVLWGIRDDLAFSFFAPFSVKQCCHDGKRRNHSAACISNLQSWNNRIS